MSFRQSQFSRIWCARREALICFLFYLNTFFCSRSSSSLSLFFVFNFCFYFTYFSVCSYSFNKFYFLCVTKRRIFILFRCALPSICCESISVSLSLSISPKSDCQSERNIEIKKKKKFLKRREATKILRKK